MNSSKQCFPPVVDHHTRVLILGSLPGEASLARGQYYAHPQNQFWRLLGSLLALPLADMDYEARLQALLAHGIGLWDVIAQAQRQGSLDSQIRDQTGNNLPAFIASLPALHTIGFNGKTAARLGRQQLRSVSDAPRLLDLPSSSPAYTSPMADKLQRWQALLAP